MSDEPAVWTIRVQTTELGGGETNTYTLLAGELPHVVSTSDRELWVQRITGPGKDAYTLVAVYARDMWARVWLEESSNG